MSVHRSSSGQHMATGRQGESMAREYLINNGYSVLSTNVRTPYGEIDLIARQAETWVFVEVKTRRTQSLGPPEISVDARKQAHMLKAVQHYCQNNLPPEAPWRIDVIAIQITGRHPAPEIMHFENALSG